MFNTGNKVTDNAKGMLEFQKYTTIITHCIKIGGSNFIGGIEAQVKLFMNENAFSRIMNTIDCYFAESIWRYFHDLESINKIQINFGVIDSTKKPKKRIKNLEARATKHRLS